ncbi:kinase-like domain-containing protein [Rhodocollybia butyracea]|uniref:non-specific serine/threonine protein kinase n=1 Tax=Rhodocollybia butyracea TaxID=206335 RepID=A0A9P5PKG0_9AGAR|nr:kinase-like domain-containing protein [Rhodocollybia butyracea]
MDPETEELQQNEITALKSIYAEDFVLTPPPKAWKVIAAEIRQGATRLPEFSIRVPHLNPDFTNKICFDLHIIFPKTYPVKTIPTFTIQKPINGLSNEQITKLSHAIHAEAQSHRGSEMVMEIVTFCQDWMTDNVIPPKEAPGSLALQMNLRAEDEEKARKQKAEALALEEQEKAMKHAQELEEQLRLDTAKQQLAREQEYRARKRANSAATEVPMSSEYPTESFPDEIEFEGLYFDTVKYFRPRNECLGVTYAADPLCDDANATLPLELHVVTFDTYYYSTSQGRKKLKQLEAEIQRLTTIRHPNVVRTLAVKLYLPNANVPSRLSILYEQPPVVTLQDVLQDCDSFREERASDYLEQILAGLNAIHAADLVHRGITPRCIGLASRNSQSNSKLIRIFKVAYFTRLVDLHKSNQFRTTLNFDSEGPLIPDAWLSKDVKNESSLLYTRHRDIHSVGIVFLQMLMGLDVVRRFTDVHSALKHSLISPTLQSNALKMLDPPKKNHVSCSTLLADLAENLSDNIRSPIVPISGFDMKTPMSLGYGSSPEIDYFKPVGLRHTSRWKEDWDELELLGKGAFGSVVKARNRIDNRIYAVKKVRLRSTQSDKIFREVNALSRLSHRFIVRYYTTWVETAEPSSTAASDDSENEYSRNESDTADGMTSVPNSSSRRTRSTDDGFIFSLDDLDDDPGASRGSFPSIHFSARSSEARIEEEDTDSDGDPLALDTVFQRQTIREAAPPLFLQRTLYIQMEFVERQTLKERVDEGLSVEEAWRLFQQIVDALVHMSNLGILHRDIKLTNIFIDGNGDCKVGDFGLATSSLAAVDPSDVAPRVIFPDADMTLEVGTRLYIAPEVQSRKRGPRNHSKADMYSLGIVFFEMNYIFSTGSERISVLERLRKREVHFPTDWDPLRTRQREIINWLLQHEPDQRPSAIELSQSPLMPPRMEDEYLKGALRLMAKPDSPHLQTVLSALFNNASKPTRGFLYDQDTELPEYASLNSIVQDRLGTIFRMHGAVDMEPPLLTPMTNTDDKTQVSFVDRHGEVVVLPNNLIVPFARLAAREKVQRIKRYHLASIYKPSVIPGHPKVWKAGVFDIITPDLSYGPIATGAEILAVAHGILEGFPNLMPTYELHISHSDIVSIILDRLPATQRSAVLDIIQHTKSSQSQKKANLLKKGLLRSLIDELEVLSDADDDIDAMMTRLEKISPSLFEQLRTAVEEVKATVQHAVCTGVTQPIFFQPLMLGSYFTHFKDGVLVEVAKKSRRSDILAAGGRYDNLINQFTQPKPKGQGSFAFGLQVDVEKISVMLALFQSTSVQPLIKEARSFGFWSPRRCDVYVIAYQPGFLQERLEVVAWLWQNGISADLMYESGLQEVEQENQVDMCAREGILFTVYPRPRAGRRDMAAFKVKSILKGTEYEVSKSDLIGWLQHEIGEQKRIDATTAYTPASSHLVVPGASQITRSSTVLAPGSSDVQLCLPQETKKQRRQVKQMFLDRAYDVSSDLKATFQSPSGMPVVAVDISSSLFDALIRNSLWLVDEEVWKSLVGEFSSAGYAQQVREAIAKKKSEANCWLLLVSVKDERVGLLNLR